MQQAVSRQARARRVAFIQSSWHKEIVDQCRIAFVEEMGKRGYAENAIDFFEVAGAFEIPLQAKILARSGVYGAVVGTGLVVDGGLYRHEFVAQAVISGLMQVQLETEVPVISAVLTPHQFHSHDDHQQFFFQHFLVKGKEAAHACADTMARLEKIDQVLQQHLAA
ncbi:6,7-dimethyl-8-ribityllumazine synthase [uncultured Oxalicibacterium sp.]|uniref:6,7-dimethyl-8-ribityllumazine synthase n=1 Tax=uncultured Oxalicibacterium sp. TaxID=1168540 RepID=UPI0025FC1130|nr:6,7-dimethyl-8-ribityllumazine synthase [uncultured Oxalicibacterium sp.]